jgi:acyl-CoA thioesterase-1
VGGHKFIKWCRIAIRLFDFLQPEEGSRRSEKLETAMSSARIGPIHAGARGFRKKFPVRGYSTALLLAWIALTNSMFVGNSSAQEQSYISTDPENAVVVLGDSNTSGYGVDPREAYPARLQENLRKRGQAVSVINAGWAGDTFGAMLSRINSTVPQTAKLVIVQGGYNDFANGVPQDVTFGNLDAILSLLRERGSKAVVCGFFDKNWDAIGRKLAAAHGATFVPGSMCYDPRNVGPDGLHMTAAGHEVVAKRLTGVVPPNAPRQHR